MPGKRKKNKQKNQFYTEQKRVAPKRRNMKGARNGNPKPGIGTVSI